jgi:predicted alpha/beta-hydrolase family hydrolase
MKKRSLKIKVSPQVGSISAISIVPVNPACLLTMAHGAGAGMTHPFMEELASSLAEAGIATLRFNFPFMEKPKKGPPDRPPVAHKTIEAVIARSQKLFPTLPLFVSGKSFGGRMTSQYIAESKSSGIKGIIFFGFPLHAPGKPSIERAEHLKDMKVPMLFLQGSRDEFAEWELIKKVTATLKKSKLVRIEGANHSYKAGKLDTLEILVKETKKWVSRLLNK